MTGVNPLASWPSLVTLTRETDAANARGAARRRRIANRRAPWGTMVPQCSPDMTLLALALVTDGDLQAAQLGAAQRRDHVLGTILRDLDERERVVDLDRADGARLEP